jgi:hypothetical protein
MPKDVQIEFRDPDELNILNPVFNELREKLNNCLQMAVMVCEGTNTVSVSLKLVIEDVRKDTFTGDKSIIAPEWSCKVSTKTDIYSDKARMKIFDVRKDGHGHLLATNQEDMQVSISEIRVNRSNLPSDVEVSDPEDER